MRALAEQRLAEESYEKLFEGSIEGLYVTTPQAQQRATVAELRSTSPKGSHVSVGIGRGRSVSAPEQDVPGRTSVYERQDLTVEQLPSYWRDQVQQRITASNLAKARAVVENLRDQAATCATSTPTTTPSATPSVTATGTASKTVAAGAKPTTTVSPTSTSAPVTTGPVPTGSPTTTPDTGCGDG